MDGVSVLRIISWIFAFCGIATYLLAWGNMLLGTEILGISTEVYFYDAIAAGVFAIFFMLTSIACRE